MATDSHDDLDDPAQVESEEPEEEGPEPTGSALEVPDRPEEDCTSEGPDENAIGSEGSSWQADPAPENVEPEEDEEPQGSKWASAPQAEESTTDEATVDPEPSSEDLDSWNDEATGMNDADWSSLEDECTSLGPGRILVGYKEFVALPEFGLKEVVARMDTGAAASRIYGTATAAGEGRVDLAIMGAEAELSGAIDEAGAIVDIQILLGGRKRSIRLQVVPESSPHPLVLGRDAMEGYLVVDVAMSFIHKRTEDHSPVR